MPLSRSRDRFLIRVLPILVVISFAVAALGDEDGATAPSVEASPSSYTTDGRPIYTVPRAGSTMRVDGVLDEEAWLDALVFELGYEVYPGDNTSAPVRTEVLVVFSESCVYFGFRAYDPDPSAIRANLSDRDSAGSDDHVGVVLDTFNDERSAFKFIVNPLGVQTDERMAESLTFADSSWDAIWDSAGRINNWGWSVEMAIPFSSLRFQRTGGSQVWGFDAVRFHPRNKSVDIGLFPRDRNNNCYLCQAVKLEGFEGASPGRNIEITPTITAVRTDERLDFPVGDLERRNQDAEVGVTARWGLTPNLALSATANPDFSQIEADALQLDINQPFALYYQEKRPFFTEGADFFSMPFDAVHTRTLRDPTWGLKLTGKEGNNTIGAYVVRDDLTNLIFPGSQGSDATSLAMANTSSVFRYQRDIWNNSTVGMLVTDREGVDYFNRIFGVDGRLRLTERDRLQFQILGSSTRYPDSVAREYGQPLGDFNDSAWRIHYNQGTRDYFLFADYQAVGIDFRADLGYMPRVDYRSFQLGSGYTWWFDTDSFIHRFQVRAYWDQMNEQDGGLIRRKASGALIAEGPMQSTFAVWFGSGRRLYEQIDFEENYVQLDFGFRPTGYISFYFEGGYSDGIDYAHARAGKEISFSPNVSVNFGRHLRGGLNYHFSRLAVGGERLFVANLADLNLVYQFNRKTFVRAILQYTDIRRNADLYRETVNPRSNALFTQLLFSYKINPRTVLFVGYSDNHFANQDFGLIRADRTFFVKLGYAWVL